MTQLQKTLFSLRDETFQAGTAKLIPNLDSTAIIGVRTPQLRKLTKQLPEAESFRKELPHRYFEENQIHAFSLEGVKNFDILIREVEAFLPYVNNWATCDQMTPKAFKKHRNELLPYIRLWIVSEHPYTIRFAIKMLMDHYLDEEFDPVYPEMVAAVHNQDYYVRMMIAWYFATALAKQYDAVLPWIAERRLEKWTHNKTIQKAVESYRITGERKEVLRQYRMK